MPKFEAVIFDLDGTLIDATESIVACFNGVLELNGLPPWNQERIIAMMGRPLGELFSVAFSANGRPPAAAVNQYVNLARAPDAPPPRLLPRSAETLASLWPRMKLAVATARTVDSANRMLAKLDLGHYFSTIVGIDEVKHPKPNPESVFLALKRLSTPARRVVFVGDTPDDMKAAKAAGVLGVGVTTGCHNETTLLEGGADRVFNDLSGLAQLLDV